MAGHPLEPGGDRPNRGTTSKTLIELKARVPELDSIRRTLLARGATLVRVVQQQDTYFDHTLGRLKLRREDPGPAELVFYLRDDRPSAKESQVHLCEVDASSQVQSYLSKTLGTKVTVVKRREVFSWRGTQVHLDTVEQLGSFVEFEHPLTDPTRADETRFDLHSKLRELGISEDVLVSGSYSDLLLSERATEGSDESHRLPSSGLSRLEQQWLLEATRVIEHAHAPYSGVRLAAVAVSEHGRTFSGCNVENALRPWVMMSVPITGYHAVHAEESAISALRASGEESVRKLLLVSLTEEPIAPCPLCRQLLLELGSQDLEVIAVSLTSHQTRRLVRADLESPPTP